MTKARDDSAMKLAAKIHFGFLESSPAAWVSVATDLIDSSVVLEWSATSGRPVARLRAALMLLSMAIEVTIKAVATPTTSYAAMASAPDPQSCTPQAWKGFWSQYNKAMNVVRSGHNLNSFAGQAKLKLSNRDRRLLDRLSHFITWEGRYPAPLRDAPVPNPREYRSLYRRGSNLWVRLAKKVAARKPKLPDPSYPVLGPPRQRRGRKVSQ